MSQRQPFERPDTQIKSRWYLPTDWPLSVKFLVGLVLVVSLASGITNYANSRTLQTQLQAEIGAEFATLANAEMNHIADILAEQLSILNSISHINQVRIGATTANTLYSDDEETVAAEMAELEANWLLSIDSSEVVQQITNPTYNLLTSQLTEYVETFPNHIQLIMTDQYGGVIAATVRPDHYDQSNEEWWQVAYNEGRGAFYVGQPVEDRGLGYTLVAMAAPIYARSGEVAGVIRSSFRMTPIYRAVDRMQLGDTGQLILIDGTGTILADPYLENRGASVPSDWTTDQLLSGARRWAETEEIDETPVLIGFAPFADIISFDAESEAVRPLGWVAIIRQTQEEAYAPVSSSAQTGIVTAAIFALVSSVLGFFLIRQTIIPPILELATAAQRMTAGELGVRSPVHWQDEIGSLAITFNAMAEQLQMSIEQLEHRVTDRTEDLQKRTAQLEAVSEVAREAAAIRDIDQLLAHTTRLVSDRFGFYHCGIFLIDETGEYAVLRAASSKGGQRMLERGHQLRVGEVGFVGYAAGTGEPYIGLDVGADAVFFDNPDLPFTRSEAALPLRIQERVIGVLDVQSTEENAFAQEYVAILQTLADQIALAIENTRLVMETQGALDRLSRYRASETLDAWHRALRRRQTRVSYYYDKTSVRAIKASGAIPLLDEKEPPQETTVRTLPDGHQILVAPIRIYEETIGYLSFEAQRPWTSDEIVMAESAVQQLGLALETARLLEDTRQRAARESLTDEVTTRMRESLDLESVVITAAQEIRQALGLDDLIINLTPTPDGDGAAERE
jgi:GAF domain-containing protein/HAMP domain-containing protein